MTLQSNRRDFIKQGSAAALSLALFPSFKRKVAPSDKLRVAHIGVNGMGTNHLNWFANLPEVDVVGLCDLDQTHLDKALNTLQKSTRTPPRRPTPIFATS